MIFSWGKDFQQIATNLLSVRHIKLSYGIMKKHSAQTEILYSTEERKWQHKSGLIMAELKLSFSFNFGYGGFELWEYSVCFVTALIFGENQLLVCFLVRMSCKNACGVFRDFQMFCEQIIWEHSLQDSSLPVVYNNCLSCLPSPSCIEMANIMLFATHFTSYFWVKTDIN